MRRKLLMVTVCASLCGMAARAEETATNAVPEAVKPASAPKIHFEKLLYDFGTTSQVQSVTGTFTFENTGDGELKVNKPAPSCGCTVAGVKPDTLKPGEKGELVFTLNAANVRGVAEKHINVPSNDPQTPNVNLTIRVNIRPTFEITPQQIALGDLRQGMITNIALVVKRLDGKKLNVTRAETGANFIKTRIEPVEDSKGEAARVWIEAEAEGVPRQFNDVVRIYVDDGAQPQVVVPVFGRLLGDVALVPEALYWGIPNAEHWAEYNNEAVTVRRVMVSATHEGKPLEVSKVTSSIKELSVQVVAVETGKTYQLVARLTDPPKVSERGSISFNTNTSAQPTVVVPVTINVLQR
jgi:hypothetical protein